MRIRNKETVLMRYPNCFISKGYLRSTVIDTHRRCYLFIPKDIVHILEKNKFKFIELTRLYGTGMEYLIKNDIVFSVDSKFSDLFPAFNTMYDSPSIIEHSIIDIENLSFNNFEFLLKQLDKFFCKSLQIRFLNNISKDTFCKFLDLVDQSSIESVEVVIPCSEWLNQDHIQYLISNIYNKITVFHIFSAKENYSDFYRGTRIFFNKEVCRPSANCGNISSRLFTVNVLNYTLSLSYNNCLYKKITIDPIGNIKNCPSSAQSFGNIKDTTLEQALNHPNFKKFWNITKDQIDVCKDCEFRHMCTDCRVFIKDPENIYSQPAKCTYNPYIAKWQGEEGYVPVEECGTYARETGFVVNHERVEELNKLLWGE
jgi:SPASM domain peptide maturase of grasp-with-spasm system